MLLEKLKLGFICFLVISLISFMIACDDSGDDDAADGTLTINLTNAASIDGHNFEAYVYAAGETNFNDATTVVAVNYDEVESSGEVTLVMENDDGNWMPNNTIWTGTGGTSYDVYIYTNEDTSTGPTGTDKMTVPMPITITIEGNMTINVDFNDMVNYVSP